MSPRAASWLAWSLWALSVALTALGLLFLALILSYPNVNIFDHWLGSTLVGITLSTVGAVIAPRTPSDNPIGWLFCIVGTLFALTLTSVPSMLSTPCWQHLDHSFLVGRRQPGLPLGFG